MECKTTEWKSIKNAMSSGNIELLGTLLIDATQKRRDMALFYAADKGLKDVVQLALTHGARTNVCHEFIVEGKVEVTAFPICRAASMGHKEIVELLLDHGAKQQSISTLYESLRNGHIEIFKLLVDRGFDVNYHIHESQAVLYYAVFDGSKEMTQVLLDYGANIDGIGNQISPIAIAARKGHIEIVKLLLDRGARQDCKALRMAIGGDHKGVVELLLERGFDANNEYNSMSVLCYAINGGNKEIVELLLDHGANINGLESDEDSPIRDAVAGGHKEIVAVLLNCGADINKGINGRTALKFAVVKGNYEISKFLIRHLILMRSENLNVSEANLNAAKTNEKLFAYQNDCSSEMELLQSTKFDGSLLSYFDVFIIKDVDKLTALASNENIVSVLKSGNFKKEFPIYGEMIVQHFDKGISGNRDFDLFKKFCNYLANRVSDRLPKLPFTFVCEMFTYLTNEDIDKLRSL